MKIKVHAFPLSPRSFKVLAVANHIGADYEFCLCDLTKGEQKRDEFRRININQRAPALEDGDFKLWESNAIIHYLAAKHPEAGLQSRDERGQADVLRWMFWESTTFDQAVAILAFERVVKPFFGIGAPDATEVERGLQLFNAAAAILNEHLKGRKFVCGEQLTLADFALASALTLEEQAQLPLAPYAEIQRWNATIKALPAWTATRAMQAAPAAAA